MGIAQHRAKPKALQHFTFDIEMAVHEGFRDAQFVKRRQRRPPRLIGQGHREGGNPGTDGVDAAIRRRHREWLDGNVLLFERYVALHEAFDRAGVIGPRWNRDWFRSSVQWSLLSY